jgi:putative tributyrin esterase
MVIYDFTRHSMDFFRYSLTAPETEFNYLRDKTDIMKKCIVIVLFLVAFPSLIHAAKVDTLAIPSAAMGKTYNAAIALPDAYAKSKSRFPVLYLLHGAYGHFGDWLKSTPDPNAVKRLADQYQIIIVMPEGERFSFYLDSPGNKESQFETYVTSEVIGAIDKKYRTIPEKKGRVIAGLSMGGHGAMYLAARHPELFAAVGSMSGAVDMGNTITDEWVKNLEPVFGPERLPQETYAGYAVMNMIQKIKANKLPLIMDIGVDDFLIDSNRELHRRLVYAKVPHDYTERPGGHTWEYWQEALPYQVLFFHNVLQQLNKPQ